MSEKTSKGATDFAEKMLEANKDKLWIEVESKLLDSLKSYEFSGDLWSAHSFDEFRYLIALGFDKAIDTFVAELEQQTWELSEGQGVVVKLEVIKQTAKRMKGEG